VNKGRNTRIARWLLLALLLAPVAASAEMALDSDAPVALQADELSYDEQQQLYRAKGAVELRQGSLQLNADAVRYHVPTSTAEAQGQVRLTDPAGYLHGEQMQLNLAQETGSVTAARGFFSAYNVHLWGDVIEKQGPQRYHVRQGAFTTCNGEVPDWKFAAREIDVTVGGMAQARHVRFYLHDVPVFYLPYLAYPVKTERESGFLLPLAGYSDNRGLQLSLAYYQVLADNQDLTLFVDHFSKMGLGTGAEYRYLFGEDNRGTLNLYYISSYGGAAYNDLSDRFAGRWQHWGLLPGHLRLTADAEYVSEIDYFDDFGSVADEYDKEEVESTLALNRAWGDFNLTGLVQYTKDLEPLADNDRMLQKLPELHLNYLHSRLGTTALYGGFDGVATQFWRREGSRGSRLEARPHLTGFFLAGGALEVEPRLAYRQRLYFSSAHEDAGWAAAGIDDGFDQAGNWEFSTRVATRLDRVFQLADSGLTRLKHSIEPEVTYGYVPNRKQSDLPWFDPADRIDHANRLSYALVNRLVGKFVTAGQQPLYRELVYLRLAQDYDLWLDRHERSQRYDQERFSPILTELILRPTAFWYVDIDADYDPAGKAFEYFNAETGLEQSFDRRLALSYRYDRDDAEYLATRLQADLLKPLYVTYEQRFDCRQRQRLENVVYLEYRSQCWSLFVGYRDRQDDQEILVRFALGGVSQLNRSGSRLGGF
jgi:LPS-assembly protein